MLSPRQFSQPEFPGMPPRTRVAKETPTPDHSTHLRGSVGEGQGIMNFDEPDISLRHDAGGLIPIDDDRDPDWDGYAWEFGGRLRAMSGLRLGDTGRTMLRGWENAPVETIKPSDQVRTNQVYSPDTDFAGSSPPYYEPFPVGQSLRVSYHEDHADDLRHSDRFVDSVTGGEARPWVAEVNDKRYLLEGHHRAIASRTRGDGSFPAHVLKGGNFGQIEEQLWNLGSR
jgi:hypothetical protein